MVQYLVCFFPPRYLHFRSIYSMWLIFSSPNTYKWHVYKCTLGVSTTEPTPQSKINLQSLEASLQFFQATMASVQSSSQIQNKPNLSLKEVPGHYDWPFFGAIKDRYDFFYNQGRDDFFKTRMAKYKSTVFRTNMPPGPLHCLKSKGRRSSGRRKLSDPLRQFKSRKA